MTGLGTERQLFQQFLLDQSFSQLEYYEPVVQDPYLDKGHAT